MDAAVQVKANLPERRIDLILKFSLRKCRSTQLKTTPSGAIRRIFALSITVNEILTFEIFGLEKVGQNNGLQ